MCVWTKHVYEIWELVWCWIYNRTNTDTLAVVGWSWLNFPLKGIREGVFWERRSSLVLAVIHYGQHSWLHCYNMLDCVWFGVPKSYSSVSFIGNRCWNFLLRDPPGLEICYFPWALSSSLSACSQWMCVLGTLYTQWSNTFWLKSCGVKYRKDCLHLYFDIVFNFICLKEDIEKVENAMSFPKMFGLYFAIIESPIKFDPWQY